MGGSQPGRLLFFPRGMGAMEDSESTIKLLFLKKIPPAAMWLLIKSCSVKEGMADGWINGRINEWASE